jgi:hypothetical protein
VIDWIRPASLTLGQAPGRGECPGGPTTTRVEANVHDGQSPAGELTVTMSYALSSDPQVNGTAPMVPTTRDGPVFRATLGPIAFSPTHADGGTIQVSVHVADPDGASASAITTVTLAAC